MNIAQLERDLVAKKAEIESALASQMTAAEAEKRERTPEERKAVETLLTEAKGLKARIDQAKGDENMTAEIAKLTAGMTVKPMATDQSRTEGRPRGHGCV